MATALSSNRRGRPDNGSPPTKRRRKSGMFVEYRPPGVDGEPSINRSVSAKQKINGSSSRYLSCAECRRLKLKCDRVFPCQACVRRGCQGICPSGSLVSGKGTRYVLASTEQLHEKISQMSDRIRELETALQDMYEELRIHRFQVLQDKSSSDADSQQLPAIHPLLGGEKLLIKDQHELYGPLRERCPSTADAEHDFDRRDARGNDMKARSPSEDFDRGTDVSSSSTPKPSADSLDQMTEGEQNADPSVILKLNTLFWSIWKNIAHDKCVGAEDNGAFFDNAMTAIAIDQLFEALPSLHEANRLCEIAQEAGFFALNYILTTSEITNIVDRIYGEQHAGVSMVDTAILFIILSIGLRVDCFSVHPQNSIAVLDEQAENYVNLSRAAMTLHAIRSEPIAFHKLELRILQYHFLLMQALAVLSSCTHHRQETKDSMDIVVALVKNAKLHVESSYLQCSGEEQDDRRFLFYEILSVVGEICLALDHPAPFDSADICQPPARKKDERHFPTRVEATYYEARRAFYVTCVKPVMDIRSSAPSAFQYTYILELDCKIRTFPFPPVVFQDYDAKPVEIADPQPSLLRLKLLRFITTYRINSVLLHLHRRFMQQCLGSQNSVLAHPYFASVVATSRSAWVLIRNCDAMHQDYPELVNRCAVPWYNVFCAGAALFILLERMPYCPMSPFSLRELLRLTEAFDKASASCSQVAVRASPIVRQFAVRGAEIVRHWRDILASEISKDSLLQSRADYCTARFDAMVRRIKQGSIVFTSSPSSGCGSDRSNDPVEEGLGIWDIAHPEIGEVLLNLPSCVIDQHTSDEALWEIVRLPVRDKNHEGSSKRSPLLEIFDSLDHQLRRRPEFLMSAVGEQRNEIPEPSIVDTNAMRDMFPADLDLDWVALTEALVCAPAILTETVPGVEWTSQWDWQHSAVALDVLSGSEQWDGTMESPSHVSSTSHP